MDKRPTNLDLLTIKQPLPAVISILHRVSGIVLFFGAGLFLWMFDRSLISSVTFRKLGESIDQWPFKLLLLAIMAALFWHLAAGLRHLLMDLGYGESLKGGLLGARIAIAAAVVFWLLFTVWLW